MMNEKIVALANNGVSYFQCCYDWSISIDGYQHARTCVVYIPDSYYLGGCI